MYKCKHFKIWELVPPELVSLPEDYLWKLFDEKLLRVIDRLREDLGQPITINNWKANGQFSQRGYRTNSSKVGAARSAHKTGMAIDLDVRGFTANKVRQYILDHRSRYPEVTELEMTLNGKPISWVHISVRPTGLKEIKQLHC